MEKRKTHHKETRAQFVLQKVQPALLGLMDGSVPTLAPIFAAAGLTGTPIKAFYVGWRHPLELVSVWDWLKHCLMMEKLQAVVAL